MINIIKKIFWPPVFEDEEKNRTSMYLNAILWAGFILLTALRISNLLSSTFQGLVAFFTNPISVLVVIIVFLLVILRLGFVRQASLFLLVATWAALAYEARSYGGLYDTAFIGNFALIGLAALLLGSTAGIFFTALAILTTWGLAYYQTSAGFIPKFDAPYNIARDETVIFILIAVISYMTINGLRNALRRASENAAEMLRSNQQLQALRDELEIRVEERTSELQRRSSELEFISKNNQRRATQLQAVAMVGNAITSIQSLENLLPRITGLIGKQFSFYHVGIFLLDDSKEYAILSATNSTGGEQMLMRGHRLLVGQQGIVGNSAATGMPRIALDTGSDATYFDNSDLPNTRSEMAIPIKIGGEIIGVLDLQSDKPSAFDKQDIELLTIVADQVAVAIQNARSYQLTQKASLETETLIGETVRRQWVAYAKERDNAGYHYSGTSVQALNKKIENPTTRLAIKNKFPMSSQDGGKSELAVPIQLRGQVIGLLNIEHKGKQSWDEDEIDIVKSIAERVSLAIENARLLQDAQSRAAKERAIGEISAKLSSTNDMENIFQTAAQELGQVIPDAEVTVQFLSEHNNDD